MPVPTGRLTISISIHALRVEGDGLVKVYRNEVKDISIHALRVEGDGLYSRGNRRHDDFYPRPPCGGRPMRLSGTHHTALISIHALRVEGDVGGAVAPYSEDDFYPRPPCGGRHITINAAPGMDVFLSTPSVWRATVAPVDFSQDFDISIHALRVEGDF